MTTPNGLVLVDKDPGLTSHDVVARVRQILGERRVGHAGTLDPMASGLLVIGVGASTRLLRFAQVSRKCYSGEVTFGVATSSLDADGDVVARAEVPALSDSDVNEVAAVMVGSQLQTPPMVSARKVGGRRLYQLAREGQEVAREARPIEVFAFTLTPSDDPARWRFLVTCSVGTYVRVLLSDLAERLGTLGHLSALRRESSGAHSVASARTLDQLRRDVADGHRVLRPPVEFCEGLERARVDDSQAARLRQGQRIALDVIGSEEVAVLDGSGNLVAVVRARDQSFQPVVVMPYEAHAD